MNREADRRGDPVRYDRVARSLHWLVAGLAVIVVSLGWAIGGAPRGSPSRDLLLLLHRSVGLTILALMLLRLAWRASHPPPTLPASLLPIERALAHLTHGLLYLAFIAMPLAGWLNSAAEGHSVSLFGLIAIPSLLPENPRLAHWAIAAHLAGQYLIYLLVSAHVVGALFHAVIKRDGVIDRMLPYRRRREGKAN